MCYHFLSKSEEYDIFYFLQILITYFYFFTDETVKSSQPPIGACCCPESITCDVDTCCLRDEVQKQNEELIQGTMLVCKKFQLWLLAIIVSLIAFKGNDTPEN